MLGAGSRLMNARNDVLLVRREPQQSRHLPCLQRERLPWMLALPLDLRFLVLLGPLTDRFKEILLFFLERLLARGAFLFVGRRPDFPRDEYR